MPAFLVYSLLLVKSQKRQVPANFYFSTDSTNDLISIDALGKDKHLAVDTTSDVTKETDRIIFIPSTITSRYQLYKVCEQDPQNPGVPCESDNDCGDYYDQPGATCNATAKACIYGPYSAWCTTNMTRLDLFNHRDHLKVTTLARVSCNGRVFSNYNKESLFYQSPLMDLLETAQLQGELLDQHASNDFTELFKQGADILVTLEWSCDLDAKPARQQCSIQRKVDVIDMGATRTVITPLARSNNGKPARLYNEQIGFRVRVRAAGGCFKTSTASLLGVVARGFAIESMCAIFMAFVLIAWHAWYRIPRAEKVFVPRGRERRAQLLYTRSFNSTGTDEGDSTTNVRVLWATEQLNSPREMGGGEPGSWVVSTPDRSYGIPSVSEGCSGAQVGQAASLC